MKICVYTLTRDRVEYTEQAFAALRAHAGCPFTHVVVDNGSKDSTLDFLTQYAASHPDVHILAQPENTGISAGSNRALDFVASAGFDVIAKYDNDAALVTPYGLAELARLVSLRDLGPDYLLSPRVTGINRQPTRGAVAGLGGKEIGLTAIVGGLFHVARAETYQQYRYPLTLPRAWGQDDDFCAWWKKRGGLVGYVEDLVVAHIDGTDGQAQRYPDYFKRKWDEERERER